MERWKVLFDYDPLSPSGLRWTVDRQRARKGNVAGGLAKHKRGGYYRVKASGRLVMAHRIVWEMHNGEIPDGKEVDHVDGVKTNNAIENLRLTDRIINCRNRAKQHNNKSGHAGVSVGDNGGKRTYYVATWREAGRQRSKRFSIDDLGADAAKSLAIAHRAAMIESLNQAGAGYTERHGT